MVRFAHFGDLHFIEGRRFEAHLAAADLLVERLKELRPHFVLIGGDLSGHDAPHHMTHNERFAASFLIIRILQLCHVVLIRGNHDELEEMNQFTLFNHHRSKHSLFVFDGNKMSTGSVDIQCGKEQVRVVAVPWSSKYQVSQGIWNKPVDSLVAGRRLLDEAIWRIEGHPMPIALMHHEVEGVTVGGFEIRSQRDVRIPREDLFRARFRYVALSHIHEQQSLAEHVVYAGSLVPLSYGERHPKGFQYVELTRRQTRSRFIPLESWDMVGVDVVKNGDEFDISIPSCNTDVPSLFVRPVIHLPRLDDGIDIDWTKLEESVLSRFPVDKTVVFEPRFAKYVSASKVTSEIDPSSKDEIPESMTLEDRIVKRIHSVVGISTEEANRLRERFFGILSDRSN